MVFFRVALNVFEEGMVEEQEEEVPRDNHSAHSPNRKVQRNDNCID